MKEREREKKCHCLIESIKALEKEVMHTATCNLLYVQGRRKTTTTAATREKKTLSYFPASRLAFFLFFSSLMGRKKDHLVVKLLQAILHGVIAHDATHQRKKERLFQLSNSITPLSNVLFSSHRLFNWM